MQIMLSSLWVSHDVVNTRNLLHVSAVVSSQSSIHGSEKSVLGTGFCRWKVCTLGV